MEKINIEKDISVFYVTARSFPDGITDAFDQLHKLVSAKDRTFYGISRPENESGIVYKAAVQELSPGEGQQLGCESMLLKKGNYVCETLINYAKNAEDIGRVFQTLLHQPDLDPNGYCVEWYFNDTDVKCMVRLKE